MSIGGRIKRTFGRVDSVDYVTFSETDNHIVAIIKTFECRITHRQVNDVLNKYPLGHWIFVESRFESSEGVFLFRNKHERFGDPYLVSIYRVDKNTALQVLEEAEKQK